MREILARTVNGNMSIFPPEISLLNAKESDTCTLNTGILFENGDFIL